jgi:hypothetical protein
MLEKSPAFNETRIFINVFIKTCQWTVSCIRWTRPTQWHFERFLLMIPSYRSGLLSRGSFPSGRKCCILQLKQHHQIMNDSVNTNSSAYSIEKSTNFPSVFWIFESTVKITWWRVVFRLDNTPNNLFCFWMNFPALPPLLTSYSIIFAVNVWKLFNIGRSKTGLLGDPCSLGRWYTYNHTFSPSLSF